MKRFRLLLLFGVTFALVSCVKDTKTEPEPVTEVSPTVTLNFKALANGKTLVPETAWYTNFAFDSLTVTVFKYYISNIKLKKEDGSFYVVPESYHLIDHVAGASSIKLTNVPPGNYTGIDFLIGVDSLRNVSGSQQGALDVTNGMFWTWEQGYIFFKLEGQYNTVNQPQRGDYAIHIGGFSGPFACLQKRSFNLTTPIAAKNNRTSVVSYNVTIDEIFEKPHRIGFDAYYAAVNEKTFRFLSENYSDMFEVTNVEN